MNGFRGYPRLWGPPGIRNAVLVLPGELSGDPWAHRIAADIPGCGALTHLHGAGNYGPDRDLVIRLLSRITVNPNIYGFIFITTGNEDYSPDSLLGSAAAHGKKFHHISIRNVRDGGALVRKGREIAHRLASEASRQRRSSCGCDELLIGLNCAGTDAASAFTSHAACGRAVDSITASGGTVVLSEIPDLIGLDDSLFGRCENPMDRDVLRSFCAFHEHRLSATGERIDDVEMGPFNVDGGLETLLQKARVSMLKAGTGPVRGVFGYGCPPTGKGLVIMDGPAMSDFVMTGYMAAGVQLMVSTCGAGDGNRMPFIVGANSPSPILPVIKVSGSTVHARRKANHIDFDAGVLVSGTENPVESGERLVKLILATASGKKAKTESCPDFMLNIPVLYYQA